MLAPFLPAWSTTEEPAPDGEAETGKDEAWNALLGESSTSVGRLGRVEAPRGLRLHAGPAADSPTLAILPFDTLVHVERKTAHGWYHVVSLGDSHQGAVTGTGCVEGPFVELDPPEPTAHLHHVKPGEMLKDIAALYYRPRRGFDWGADARLYVEAIWEANKTTGKLTRTGGDLSWAEEALRSDEQEKTQAIWQSVRPKANHAIWIPGPAFVAALEKQGAITGGSISHAAWETAKEAGQAFVELVTYGAGFQIGALQGAFGAAKDLILGVVDLLGLVRDLIQSLLGEGLLGTARSIGKKLVELFEKAPALLQQVGSWFVARWTQTDDFARGQFHGEVIGYILVQVLLAVLTMGGSATLQASGRFATAVQVIRGLDAAGDILTFARGAARAARLPGEALSRMRKAGGRADDVADAVTDATRRANVANAPSTPPGDTAETTALAAGRRTPAQRGALSAELPPELRGDVPIVESDAIQGAGVHVVYKDGDVRIEVGPDAEPRHVRYHAETARHLLRFQGPLGSVRRLLDAILTKLRLTPGYGTLGFEANLEVKKLLAIQKELQELQARLDGRARELSRDLGAVDSKDIERELAQIEEQLELHRREVDSYEPGRGFVAAEGRSKLPEYAIRRADMFEEVSESGEYWEVTYKARTADGRTVEWGTTSVQVDDQGNPISGPENVLRARLDREGVEHALHFYDEVEHPAGASRPVGRGQRFSATQYALARSVELYRRRFGHTPDTLSGQLGWDNKLHFQLEFLRLRPQHPNLPTRDLAVAAVKNISFGKHRVALGFDHFEVQELTLGRADLPGHGEQQVPIKIVFKVRRSK